VWAEGSFRWNIKDFEVVDEEEWCAPYKPRDLESADPALSAGSPFKIRVPSLGSA